MSDARRPHGAGDGSAGGPPSNGGPSVPDPAYAQQYVYPAQLPSSAETRPLPAYWTQTQTPTPAGAAPPPDEPEPPKRSRRWLWLGAAAAILLVAALVLALVITSGSPRKMTATAPSSTTTTRVPSTTTTTPPVTTTTAPATTTAPTTTAPQATVPPATTTPPRSTATTSPGGTDTVVYSVSGTGRAINITYIDDGGVVQVLFNVPLPWSQQVSLAAPAKNLASVTVVNAGRNITCSLSINGQVVKQRSGAGLTVCASIN